ncbi:hypothetical protein AB835_14325 [Candidatus Endobugula sertula]|uniref:Uncharacterized protein n=1 Tax=Candidatus Endobugula sertula TaxID=62101 RepID=A0A1D2QLG3_9GAMM|nr:hypothetical protein AB835_14325 [Candidatus Endobugula sertula]
MYAAGQEFEVQKTDRVHLAKMIMKLFENWQLKTEDQLSLLGLFNNSKATLTRYRNGQPLATNRDMLERVSILLAIHKSLRLIFPKNHELAYYWITTKNNAFAGMTPIEVITKRGFTGLFMVRAYLDKIIAN